VRYRFIEDHATEHRVTALCRALKVSRSGYYGWKTRPECERARANRRLLTHTRAVHARSREAYGIVKTWHALTDQGICCGRNRVARLRRLNGIEARRRRRYRLAYAARNNEPAAPNLLKRDFTVDRPDRVWVGDITFVPTREGWLHLAVLLDLHSRRVVGWAMSERQNRPLAIDALVMAIERRKPKPGLIHHTDQGIVYASSAYRKILKTHHVIPSMSRKGDCYDNAVAESFFSGLKNELVWSNDFRTRAEARGAIFEWIEVFYNRERLHQTLDYVSPVRYEERAVVP
jgi:transposase InsO family protein